MVKIYNVIPIIIPETVLEKRIKFYHDFGVQISTGSTITELSILENYFDKFVKESKKLGFDIIEIAENNIQLDIDQKKKIVSTILSNGLNFHWKVGRKDPRHQLGVEDTLSKIDETITKIGSEKVLIEANEGINAGIYDERGSVKWNFVGALLMVGPMEVDRIINTLPIYVNTAFQKQLNRIYMIYMKFMKAGIPLLNYFYPRSSRNIWIVLRPMKEKDLSSLRFTII